MPVTRDKPRGFLAVRPVTCPPRQAPAVPVPDLGRPSPRSAEPVAAPSATRPDCLSRQALAVSVPGRSSPACQERSSRLPPRRGRSPVLPGRPRPLHLGPGRPSPRPSGTRRGSPPRPGRVPATNRHPTSSIAPAMCPRASPRAGVTPRTPLPYATSPKFFPTLPPALQSLLPSRPPARAPLTRIGGIFSSHPSDARERPKVHPTANSPGNAFRPGRGGPAVPAPGPVLASVASDDSADPRAFRRRFRPGHPGPSRRTPASQPRRAQGRRPSPSPSRRRPREIGSRRQPRRLAPSPRDGPRWTFGRLTRQRRADVGKSRRLA